MKIVVISGYAQSLINFRGPMLAAFVKAGHEVIACAPGADKDPIARLAELGVVYRKVNLDRTGLNPIQDLRTLFHLSKLLRDVRPEIVFSYNHKPVIYGSLAARRAGVPKRFSLITGLGLSTSRRLLGEGDTLAGAPFGHRIIKALAHWLYRLSLSGNEAVFFQNPDDLAFFVGSGLVRDPKRAVLINGTGVDLSHYHEVPPHVQGPVFLMIARLVKEKGVVEYVAAARTLRRRYPRAKFRLLGPFDPDHPSSGLKENQIETWQQEGIIEYLGEVKDVRPFIADASAFVLPSYREGTPRTTLEAMAMGRPVVTTDTPGCRETVVDGENGFLVPAKDVIALAEAMERFIVHPGLIVSMGKVSRRIAAEKYDVHKVNSTIMETMGLLQRAS